MSHILSNFYQANFTPHKKVSCQSFATFRIPSVFLHDLFCFVIVSLPSKSFIHGNLLPHRSVLQPERIRTLSHPDKAHLFIKSSATLISLNVIHLKLENAVLPGNPFQLCKHGGSDAKPPEFLKNPYGQRRPVSGFDPPREADLTFSRTSLSCFQF